MPNKRHSDAASPAEAAEQPVDATPVFPLSRLDEEIRCWELYVAQLGDTGIEEDEQKLLQTMTTTDLEDT